MASRRRSKGFRRARAGLLMLLLVGLLAIPQPAAVTAAPGGNPGRPPIKIDPPWEPAYDYWCSTYSGSEASPCVAEASATYAGAITTSVDLSSPQDGQAPSPVGRSGEGLASVVGTTTLKRPADRIDIVVTVDVRSAFARREVASVPGDQCSSSAYLESRAWYADCFYCTVAYERIWLAQDGAEGDQASPGLRTFRYSAYKMDGGPIPAGSFSVMVEAVTSANLGIGAAGRINTSVDAVVTSITVAPKYE